MFCMMVEWSQEADSESFWCYVSCLAIWRPSTMTVLHYMSSSDPLERDILSFLIILV